MPLKVKNEVHHTSPHAFFSLTIVFSIISKFLFVVSTDKTNRFRRNISLLLIFLTLALSVHQVQFKAALAQETYDYSIGSGVGQLELSNTFSKLGSDLPTLIVGTEILETAQIGQVALNRLYGWGPPSIKVVVSGIGVSDSVTSQTNGYWEFVNLYMPKPVPSSLGEGLYFPEICVQAFEDNVATQPSCIPTYLAEDLPDEIGPVLLSPTLSLENSYAEIGHQVLASGKTTPNSTVYISLANENRLNFFSIVRQVFAYTVPSYEIQADDTGYFEFNLPSKSPDSWKVYATAEILGANSPKSTTLNFFAISGFWAFVKKILLTLQIGRFSFMYFVGLEVVLIIILLYALIRKRSKNQKSTHKQPAFNHFYPD